MKENGSTISGWDVLPDMRNGSVGKKSRPAIQVSVCWEGPLPVPSVRIVEDLRDVLADPGCTCTGPAYYMYRDVARSAQDHDWLTEQRLRFDVTVIPPREICGEFIKTKGHYHPDNPSGTGYPEIYEVLAGEANYLLQNRDCSHVVMVAACAGDIVIVPPGYGHVTINPSKTAVLQMANIVSSQFTSDYRPYEVQRGAAFFAMAAGGFVPNPAYPEYLRLRYVKERCPADAGNTITGPLYHLIEKRAEILEFLNSPEKHDALFRQICPFRFLLIRNH